MTNIPVKTRRRRCRNPRRKEGRGSYSSMSPTCCDYLLIDRSRLVSSRNTPENDRRRNQQSVRVNEKETREWLCSWLLLAWSCMCLFGYKYEASEQLFGFFIFIFLRQNWKGERERKKILVFPGKWVCSLGGEYYRMIKKYYAWRLGSVLVVGVDWEGAGAARRTWIATWGVI